MRDQEVLKYKDIVLRTSDMDVLEGPCFLNDQVIGFYFSYLSSSLLCGYEDDIAFVPPSVSFWLANCDVDSRKDTLEPLKLSGKRLVLFTVNDSDGDESTGTHWSILVYDRSKNSFLHLDTMQGMNHDHAFKLYDAVKEYMGKASVPVQSNLKKKKTTKPTTKQETVSTEHLSFKECEAPQQTNGYDCGIYVMAIAKAICEFNLSAKKNVADDWLPFVQKHVDTSIEMTFRNEIMLLIQDLRKKNH